MSNIEPPKLQVLAGINGAGKSTLFEEVFDKNVNFINPDVIARAISPSDFNNPVVSIAAGREAIKQTNDALNTQQSFAIETTLSDNRGLRVIQEAKEKGFSVELYYVGLDSVDTAIDRVASRVSKGGHDIPTENIIRRFDKSINNLPEAMLLSDNVSLFDNTLLQRKKLFVSIDNEVEFINREIPSWAENAIKKYEMVRDIRENHQYLPNELQQSVEKKILKGSEKETSERYNKNIDFIQEEIKNYQEKHSQQEFQSTSNIEDLKEILTSATAQGLISSEEANKKIKQAIQAGFNTEFLQKKEEIKQVNSKKDKSKSSPDMDLEL